jgi:hypothetical protein
MCGVCEIRVLQCRAGAAFRWMFAGAAGCSPLQKLFSAPRPRTAGNTLTNITSFKNIEI